MNSDTSTAGYPVPSADNDAAWANIADHHMPGCEWTETRAHRWPAHAEMDAMLPARLGLTSSEFRAWISGNADYNLTALTERVCQRLGIDATPDRHDLDRAGFSPAEIHYILD